MQKRRHLISGILLATALGTSLAGARQITPVNGNPRWGSEANCFNVPNDAYPSRLVQQCEGTHTWLFDIPIDKAGSGNRTGNLYGAGGGAFSGTMTCYVDSYTIDGATGSWAMGTRDAATWDKLTFNGTNTWTVWAPDYGTLHAWCNLPKGTGVSGMFYNANGT